METPRVRGGRGFHRSRPMPLAPVIFVIAGHRFETSGRDLWATPAGRRRADRVKVTRSSVSRSAAQGYPPALVWSPGGGERPVEELMAAARYWIAWSKTDGYARFPEVGLEKWLRALET